MCAVQAKFRILVAGMPAELNLYGYKVGLVCKPHANSIASRRPGAKFEAL